MTTDQLAVRLATIVGESHVLTDPAVIESYEVDWTGLWRGEARLVVRPGTTDEVARIVVACAAVGVPIVPQGGNTGLVGGSVPAGVSGAVVLSLRRLSWLGPVDPVAGQVVVGAGATIADVQRHARAAGWDLGLDFASRDSATIGGAIATNAGGTHVLRYGSARSMIVDVEAVLADGRILSRPRPTHVAGPKVAGPAAPAAAGSPNATVTAPVGAGHLAAPPGSEAGQPADTAGPATGDHAATVSPGTPNADSPAATAPPGAPNAGEHLATAPGATPGMRGSDEATAYAGPGRSADADHPTATAGVSPGGHEPARPTMTGDHLAAAADAPGGTGAAAPTGANHGGHGPVSGAPVKDSAGYDLPGLLAGSEGTLAILTAVRLRLVPLLPARVVALLGVDGTAAAQRVLNAVQRRVPDLAAAELMHADGLALVREHRSLPPPLGVQPPTYLLLECAGWFDPTETLAAALNGLPEVRDVAVAADQPGCTALWAYREGHTDAINAAGVPVKLDVAVPAAVLPAAEAAIEQAVSAVAPDARTVLFGHLAEANLHVNVLNATAVAAQVTDAVLQVVTGFGGSISAEHGIGRAKPTWLPLTRSPVEIATMRAIKSALDPAGLLNPGVLFP